MQTLSNIALSGERNGNYVNFFEREIDCLLVGPWAEIGAFNAVIASLNGVNFQLQTGRDQAIVILNGLPIDAPFSATVRFPDGLSFLAFPSELVQLFGNLRGAISLKNRDGEVTREVVAGGPQSNRGGETNRHLERTNNDFMQDMRDGVAAYFKGIASAVIIACRSGHLWNRYNFEKKLALTYTIGAAPNPPVPALPAPSGVGRGNTT